MKATKARLGFAAMLVAATAVTVLPATPAGAAYTPKCQFREKTRVGNNWHIREGGGNLLRGEVCQTGNAKLTMQNDGNLVLYNQNGGVTFSANTYATWTKAAAIKAEFQADGNFVAYNYAEPRWDSGTWSACGGSAACELVIQADGNVVIYNMSNGQAVWDAW